MKPDWSEDSRLLSRIWLYRSLKTSLSKSLFSELRSNIGRWFDTRERSPFLGTGQTLASLKSEGTIPVRSDWLNRQQYGRTASLASSRRMRLPRPFGPLALPIGRDLRIVRTSTGVTLEFLGPEKTMLFPLKSMQNSFVTLLAGFQVSDRCPLGSLCLYV